MDFLVLYVKSQTHQLVVQEVNSDMWIQAEACHIEMKRLIGLRLKSFQKSLTFGEIRRTMIDKRAVA